LLAFLLEKRAFLEEKNGILERKTPFDIEKKRK